MKELKDMVFEIWLGDHYSHFEKGLLHLSNGSSKELKGWIHSATYGPDTLLVADKELTVCPDFPVRWYIRENGLSFYAWAAEVSSIVFHNESGKGLEIGRFGVLENGATKEYKRSVP